MSRVIPPCGVMVSNDPRARCTKESDHAGPCDFVPDRHGGQDCPTCGLRPALCLCNEALDENGDPTY